uniref:Bestrophin homolog n=1 Tax=Syphacia muris TaxID=451379 RepID=A0A0N5AUF2_9BILA
MTVPYTSLVATLSFTGFIRAMLIWRGSVWKLVWSELFIWSLLFALFSLIYRLALNDSQQTSFEKFCVYCYMHADMIPFEFILGYYITLIVSRWSKFWINLGFLDNICLTTIVHLRHGDIERAQLYRRNIVRMILLYQIMVYRIICPGVRKMYPTLESLVEAGITYIHLKFFLGYINESEIEHFAENKFWMPIKWCMYLIRDARKEGLIINDFGVQQIYEYVIAFRENVIHLWLSDWVPVPLAYTQIAFTSIRIYFLVLIFGRQFLQTGSSLVQAQIDVYVPFITIIQFITYVGWCKLGETLVNPFGSDDDDFDYKFVMNRNLNVLIFLNIF